MLDIEIMEVENGYVILEWPVATRSNPFERKKWVALTVSDLGDLVKKIAIQYGSTATANPQQVAP